MTVKYNLRKDHFDAWWAMFIIILNGKETPNWKFNTHGNIADECMNDVFIAAAQSFREIK